MLYKTYSRVFPVFLLIISLFLVACGDNPTAVTTTASANSTQIATQGAAFLHTPTASTSTNPPFMPTATPAVIAPTTSKSGDGVTSGKIVFDFENQIFLINPDGTGKTKLTDGATPIFSPDGKRVAYTVMEGSLNGTPPAKYIIRSINLDGSDKQDLCVGKDNYLLQLVRWSPRNRFIAALSGRLATDAFGLVALCNLTDKKVTELDYNKRGPLAVYDWTPDGENAVWSSSTDDSYDLFYGDPDKAGAGAVTVVKGQPFCKCGIETPDFGGARFSPDGKTLALTNEDKIKFQSVPGQNSSLNGKEIALSPDRKLHPTRLSWSPDGQSLAVTVRDEQGKSSLRIISLDAKQFGQSKTITENAFSLDWTR